MFQLPSIRGRRSPIVENINRASLNSRKSLQRHKLIISDKAFFPLLTFKDFASNSYTKEYLAKCFYKALENLKYDGYLEDIDRRILQLIFSEFGIFITEQQLTEGYFFASFSSDTHRIENEEFKEDDDNFEKEIKRLESKFGSKSKVLEQQENDAKIINKIDNYNKKSNKFDFRCFISWLRRNICKMHNFTAAEIKQNEKNKEFETSINQNHVRINQSFDQPKKITENQKTIGQILPNNTIKKSNYKGLYNLLEKKKMLNMDYPEIDLKKKPIVIFDNANFTGLESDNNSSLINSQSRRKKGKGKITLDDEKKVMGYKYLTKIDQDIKAQIKSCFIDFKEENPATKKLVFSTIKGIHFDKLKNDEETGIDYAKLAKLRLKHTQELNNLKTFQEMIMIMREQESALEATRLYELLYTNDQATEERLKKFNDSKKNKTKTNDRLKALLNEFPL